MTQPDAHTPGFAIVAPTQEWYRHALHRRIVREIPELRLHSIYTHAQGVAHRARRDESDINAVFFDSGQSTGERNKLSNQLDNLRRGKRIFEYFKANNVKAAVILGYNDLGILRLYQRCKRAGIKTFLWSDSNAAGDRATGLKRTIKGAIIRHVASHTDAVLVCGSLGKAFYTSYGVPESKVLYSPYEPDYQQIRALPQSAIDDTRAKFKLDPDRRRFAFCGRLVRIKRPDLVISAFVNVANERPNWDLLIIGDGDMRTELVASVPQELKDRVTFTGFIGEQAQVSALYRLSDVLLHPCEIEPWGLIINEAVAAGLAVVTTTACGAGVELVEPGVNGFLVPPGEAEPLTQAVRTISEPGTADRMKAQSQNVLDRWQEKADPVRGIRQALARAGVIPSESKPTP